MAHERILTTAEVQAINDWVNGGAPSGDLALTPPIPVYATGITLPSYDLVLTMPSYTVNTTTDLYRCFVLPSTLVNQKMITLLEVIPGNDRIVHHVLVYQDTTGQAALLDANDADAGYTSFGGIGVNSAKLIAGWVPGSQPMALPNGFGIRLAPNSDIVLQIHYPGGTSNEVDSTKIVFKFAPSTSGIRSVSNAPILNHSISLIDGPLFIPANETRTLHARYVMPQVNVSLLSVGPHMHLIGKSISSWAVSPTGDTIPFTKINNWDFHWQGSYNFKRIKKIPAGSTLFSEAFYDNTTNNSSNPSNPPVDVSLGESTTDEMMLIYFQYLQYHNGDENILMDSSDITTGTEEFDFSDKIKTPQLYDLYPNPSSLAITADFYLPSKSEIALSIIDINGKEVLVSKPEVVNSGITIRTFDISKLPVANYSLILKTKDSIKIKHFSKQ
ncbi:MAG: T9SS type A sorting domain-containing protein [Ferruginibacter sp.]